VEPLVAGWDLGTGESHVLSWAARNQGFEAVVDDRAARKCAEVIGVPVRGTLGLLLLAKREKRIDRVAYLLEQARQAGLFVDPETGRAILRLAGENGR
jgi:predicted nucleic acid-binding protein